jgi:isopenicillin N synthase-like dioxygenase
MQKIPSVDLRDFLSDDPIRKQKFVNEIGKAYEEIGFVALKGHFLNPSMKFQELEVKEGMFLLVKSMQKVVLREI